MNPFAILGAVAALWGFGIAVSQIKTGRSQLGDWVDDRRRNPVRFWITVGLWMALSGAMAIMTWHDFQTDPLPFHALQEGSGLIGSPIVIGGIPLPSDAPIFLTFIAAHLAAGLTAVVAGAVAMLSRKQAGRHPVAGTVYYWALAIVSVTMSVLAFSRWSEDYHLFVLGLLAFIAATIGRTARQRLWRGWPRIHMTGMGVSYILMITAFYVDNGPNLPFWRELPPIAFWILPTLIGAPILLNALIRHPLVRQRISN